MTARVAGESIAIALDLVAPRLRRVRRHRGLTLTEVGSTLEGVLDARGATGLDDSIRNGFERISVTFTIKGEAPPEKLREIVERAKARSVVYDIITNGVPVDVHAEVG